jgi:ribose-phosphate pyrophosphokinase
MSLKNDIKIQTDEEETVESKFLVFPSESKQSSILAEKIANGLGVEVSRCDVVRFKDDESQPQFKVSVNNKICVVVTSLHQTDRNSNDNSWVLLQMCNALHTSHAKEIIIVAPYTPYARQDKPDDNRSCVTSGLFAKLLNASCGSTPVRYITLDLHAGQLWTVFNALEVRMDNLHSEPHMISLVKEMVMKKHSICNDDIMVVAPDGGAAKRAKRFADEDTGLNCGYALMDKTRKKAGEVASVSLIGSVKNMHAIIGDDMCDTGGTICRAAEKLKEEGAKSVTVMFCHGVFSGNALKRLQESPAIDMVVFTNTCDKSYNVNEPVTLGEHDNITFSQLVDYPKFYMIDITWLLSQAVKCRLTRGSVSKLFELRCTSEKHMQHLMKDGKKNIKQFLTCASGSDLHKCLD